MVEFKHYLWEELCEWCRDASANIEKGRIEHRRYLIIYLEKRSKLRCLGCAILFEVGNTCLQGLANLEEMMFALRFWGNEVKRQRLAVDPYSSTRPNIGIRVLLSDKPRWCLHGLLLRFLILFRPTQSVESGNRPQPCFCNDGDR